MYERFEQLLKEKNVTPYRVSKETGIATATLSDWKNGRSTPKNDKLQKIADYFGVSLDYLTGRDEKEIKLNKKDEKEISKLLDTYREELMTSEGLMFDGEPATPEEIESIIAAMQIGLEMVKKKNKEKYTPKKYRK